MLQLAQNELLRVVAEKAKLSEEEFFEGIENKLHKLCRKIAAEAGADSAAVFLVTEDNPPGSLPLMVMRGASGRLRKTFNARAEEWRSWRRRENEESPRLSGFAYQTGLTDEFLALEAEERQQAIMGWSVTNQVWHLAQGRIANSNRAMDEQQGGPSRTGRGDAYAYPGRDLRTTFRSLIAVPIFAQGGRVQAVQSQKEKGAEEKYPASSSPSAEFLSKYRVIGILKVEGKHPSDDGGPAPDLMRSRLMESLSRAEITHGVQLTKGKKRRIVKWYLSVCEPSDSLHAEFDKKGTPFPRVLVEVGQDAERDRKARLLRKEIADVLTRSCRAEFTRQDMELLVLLAMQVGRVMTHRVIKYAADKDIVLSENEVGLLNVRWRDVDHLAALGRAAEAATQKVKHHLEALKAELDFAKRQEVYQARVSELLDTHGPIRELSARTKKPISLIRKLARKQRHLDDAPHVWELSLPGLKSKLEGYDHRSGERFVARGNVELVLQRLEIGRGVGDMTVRLGTGGTPQLSTDEKEQVVVLIPDHKTLDLDLPLIRRILDPDFYHVDDLAGARVIVDYDSDIDEVLEELKARARRWGIGLVQVDDLREGKEGGYRAVHVTIQVDVRELIPAGDVKTLLEALELPANLPLTIPVEIQLRTAYQNSWATKVHDILYKREERVAQELRDEHEILSNVLREADWLSDIVRSDIETMLLPSDHGERKLLEHLKRRIPSVDLIIVRFGFACAREILKDRLRYNGQPEFSFAMEVCDCLVRKFGVMDSSMLLLALLYNVWGTERGEVGWLAQARGERQFQSRERDDGSVSQFCQRLERACNPVLNHYRWRLPLPLKQQMDSDWLKIWMEDFPTWFWAIQLSFRDYFLHSPEDLAKQWNARLRNVYRQLKARHQEGSRDRLDQWLERAYMLESAILLASLSDLPDEPGGARRKRLHNDYLSLYREIRKYLPNGATKNRIIEELDRAFRELETRLDLPREPEWWGE
jgi:ppGpp synthetase/RelA/SpoT-type nucleotidyltranferase